MDNKMSSETAYNSLFRDYPDIVGVKEICKMLGLGSKKVYQLIQDEKIKKIPCGRNIKVAKVSVIDYVLQSAQ
jgi:excisionase family DNA binding protein